MKLGLEKPRATSSSPQVSSVGRKEDASCSQEQGGVGATSGSQKENSLNRGRYHDVQDFAPGWWSRGGKGCGSDESGGGGDQVIVVGVELELWDVRPGFTEDEEPSPKRVDATTPSTKSKGEAGSKEEPPGEILKSEKEERADEEFETPARSWESLA